MDAIGWAAEKPVPRKRVVRAAVVPVPLWTGWYIGAHLGAAIAEGDGLATFQRITGGTVLHPLQTGQFLDGRSFGFAGAQLGYNYQMGAWVVGIETDISGSSKATSNVALAEGPITDSVERRSSVDWFGTVRPRLGFLLLDNTLIYGTAGYAYGQVRDQFNAYITGPGPVGVFTLTSGNSHLVSGWVAGGGFEIKLDPRWSFKAEYQFLGLNESNTLGSFIQFTPGGQGQRCHLLAAGRNDRGAHCAHWHQLQALGLVNPVLLLWLRGG